MSLWAIPLSIRMAINTFQRRQCPSLFVDIRHSFRTSPTKSTMAPLTRAHFSRKLVFFACKLCKIEGEMRPEVCIISLFTAEDWLDGAENSANCCSQN